MKKTIQPKPRRESFAVYGIPWCLSIFFAWMYVSMQMHGLYGGDAGDLVTASAAWGIPHPPGYPLYTFLSGLIIRVFPFDTVAWRACFLSSIPSVLALYFLWRVCFRMTKSVIASTIAAVSFGLAAPVWVNAMTQEVFGLFSLFGVVFLDQIFAWFEDGKQTRLLFLSFWTGLSFTHHHAVLFIVLPTILFMVWRRRDLLSQVKAVWWKLVGLFLLGLLPYLYAPIVSKAGTLFDMENAASISGFFRLLTRASYGTFQATAGGSPMLINRLLNIYTFFQFLVRDFSAVGVAIIVAGLLVLRKKNSDVYDYLTMLIGSWIVFFFLAGFSQLLNYHIGTIERFFVVPYQLYTLCLACGLNLLFGFRKRIVWIICVVALCLMSIPRWYNNYRSFINLRTDHSMEQLATDIVKSTPENAILFLFEDTSTYAVYYLYFVEHARPDIKFVFFRWLGQPVYRQKLRALYPELTVPEAEGGDYGKLLASFIQANVQKFPLMSDTESAWFSGKWIPYGLLFAYIPDANAVISHAGIVETTRAVWKELTPPVHLIPFHKEIPMISDILRVYGQHRAMVVREMVLADMPIEDISKELGEAFALERNVVPEAYLYPAVLLYEKGRCGDAKILLSLFVKKWGYDRAILRQYYKWKLACGSDADVDPFADFYMQRFPKDIQ